MQCSCCGVVVVVVVVVAVFVVVVVVVIVAVGKASTVIMCVYMVTCDVVSSAGWRAGDGNLLVRGPGTLAH